MKKLPLPKSEYRERLEKCRQRAKDAGFDALLVFSHSPDRPGNTKYLVNYCSPTVYYPSSLPDQPLRRGTGYACLLVPVEDEPVLVKMSVPVHPDHVFPPEVELPIDQVKEFDKDITEAIADTIREKNLGKSRIGIAGEDVISAYLMRLIKEKLPNTEFGFADNILQEMRMVLSNREIEVVKKTAEMADRVLRTTVQAVKPGIGTVEVAGVAAAALLKEGVERTLFIDIQAGPTQAWIEGGNRIIGKNEIVMVDLGFTDPNGYFADVGPTFLTENSSRDKRDLVRLARETTDFVAQSAIPGTSGREWMKKVRAFVQERLATGKYDIPVPDPIMFLGNSMGHDLVSLFFGPETTMELKEGMFLSIEPWIRTAKFAAKFEDLILVRKTGGEFLTKYRVEI